MLNIIHPFMRRLGTLWLSGSVGPAQEHFISHLIRQKLIAAIDAQGLILKPQSKKFLLYLPEGELHEIGILFANYILRARKHSVVYLGQSLPYEELLIAYGLDDQSRVFCHAALVGVRVEYPRRDQRGDAALRLQVFVEGLIDPHAALATASNAARARTSINRLISSRLDLIELLKNGFGREPGC